MNAFLATADLPIHVGIVLTALVAAIVVVWIGAVSRLTRADVAPARILLHGPALKARGPVALASGSDSWLMLERVQLPGQLCFVPAPFDHAAWGWAPCASRRQARQHHDRWNDLHVTC